MTYVDNDPRTIAFCSPKSPDVFHGVVGATEVWSEDPFDVESLHQSARETFSSLANNATNKQTAGRILTIVGRSGTGKTHLMRAFRTQLHGSDLGYFGYLQLTSPSQDYGRFILTHLIDSLNHPQSTDDETTGLMRLSNAVAEMPSVSQSGRVSFKSRSSDLLTALREWDIEGKKLAELVRHIVKRLLTDVRFQQVDGNILSAMLYLQAQDPFVKNIVLTYLRTGRVAPGLADVVPLLSSIDDTLTPIQVVAELAKLMWATQGKILVICADQLDEMLSLDDNGQHINRALEALVNISAAIPSSIVVVSCLEAVYDEIVDKLSAPVRNKIQMPPSPLSLRAQLETKEEIESLVGKRLGTLFDSMDVPIVDLEPCFPFKPADLGKLVGLMPRDVLSLCARFHQEAVAHGQIPAGLEKNGKPDDAGDIEKQEARWQQYLTENAQEIPIENARLVEILERGVPYVGQELGPSISLQAKREQDYICVSGTDAPFLVGICNKRPQGGGLLKEIRALEDRAGERPMVIVRSGEFPKLAKSQVSIRIGEIIARGGRRAQVEDPDWASLLTLPEFLASTPHSPAVTLWQQKMRPLTRFRSIQRMVGISDVNGILPHEPVVVVESASLESARTAGTQQQPTSTAVTKPVQPVEPNVKPGLITAGVSDNRQATPVDIQVDEELVRHAAFLGGSGSGKSTLAMNVIEQLLLLDIPVLLIDRKGDLANYANAESWDKALDDPGRTALRAALRERVDVELFTPGNPNGRPLSIAIVPDGTHLLPPYERERIAKFSGSALADVMGLRSSHTDRVSRAILNKAIYLLTEIDDPEEVLLEEIIELVGERAPALVNLVGDFDARYFQRLYESLLTLRVTRGHLLDAEGERVSAELLFGLGRYKRSDKTRLSIISTKFFGDDLDREFFIAQVLLELGRMISKHPSDSLQAAVLFDEADIYLPATRKPATKEPLEDLLKRARSGGLGVMLATQSPGDLDYKSKENIRTWFVGKIKETTALAKLKPMLSQGGSDTMQRVGGLNVGQFYMAREDSVQRIRGQRNVIDLEQLPEDLILRCARR